MSKKNIHDKGIETRIQQIYAEDGDRLLTVIPNVEYINPHDIKQTGLCGELDILKIYFNGKIGIEEVKCTMNGYDKAQEQLKRASNIFKYFQPKLATYIVNEDRVFRKY